MISWLVPLPVRRVEEQELVSRRARPDAHLRHLTD